MGDFLCGDEKAEVAEARTRPPPTFGDAFPRPPSNSFEEDEEEGAAEVAADEELGVTKFAMLNILEVEG